MQRKEGRILSPPPPPPVNHDSVSFVIGTKRSDKQGRQISRKCLSQYQYRTTEQGQWPLKKKRKKEEEKRKKDFVAFVAAGGPLSEEGKQVQGCQVCVLCMCDSHADRPHL